MLYEIDRCEQCSEYIEECACCEVCSCTDGHQYPDGTFCEECYAEACE